jgi:hypothetical protein
VKPLKYFIEEAQLNHHTTYSRNNMCQKCGGYCGLWVLIEIIQKKCPENMKKIVGALWELPAK